MSKDNLDYFSFLGSEHYTRINKIVNEVRSLRFGKGSNRLEVLGKAVSKHVMAGRPDLVERVCDTLHSHHQGILRDLKKKFPNNYQLIKGYDNQVAQVIRYSPSKLGNERSKIVEKAWEVYRKREVIPRMDTGEDFLEVMQQAIKRQTELENYEVVDSLSQDIYLEALRRLKGLKGTYGVASEIADTRYKKLIKEFRPKS